MWLHNYRCVWWQQTDDLGTRFGNPDIPLTYVYVTGCRKIRFGGVTFLFFLTFCSLFGALHDNEREDIVRFCIAFRIDDDERRCCDSAVVISLESLLLESLVEQCNSKLELTIAILPEVEEHESVEELRESSSPCVWKQSSSCDRRPNRRLIMSKTPPNRSRHADGESVDGDTLRDFGAGISINITRGSSIILFLEIISLFSISIFNNNTVYVGVSFSICLFVDGTTHTIVFVRWIGIVNRHKWMTYFLIPYTLVCTYAHCTFRM